MSIPLYILLIIYFVALIVYFILSFFNLYHIFRFGFKDVITRTVILFYLIITIVILSVSGIFIANIDWSETWHIFDVPDVNISIQ